MVHGWVTPIVQVRGLGSKLFDSKESKGSQNYWNRVHLQLRLPPYPATLPWGPIPDWKAWDVRADGLRILQARPGLPRFARDTRRGRVGHRLDAAGERELAGSCCWHVRTLSLPFAASHVGALSLQPLPTPPPDRYSGLHLLSLSLAAGSAVLQLLHSSESIHGDGALVRCATC